MKPKRKISRNERLARRIARQLWNEILWKVGFKDLEVKILKVINSERR